MLEGKVLVYGMIIINKERQDSNITLRLTFKLFTIDAFASCSVAATKDPLETARVSYPLGLTL